MPIRRHGPKWLANCCIVLAERIYLLRWGEKAYSRGSSRSPKAGHRLLGRPQHLHARSPEAITRALARVIRERWSADKALRRAAARSWGAADEGRVHDRRQRGRGPRRRGAEARSGGAILRSRRAGSAGPTRDVLQRRPEGARPVGPRPRAGRHPRARSGPTRICRPASRRATASSWVDPHVRRVPVVPRGVPEPLRAPPAVRVRPVPGRVRGARPPCRRSRSKNLIPLPDDLPSDLATVADPFACALNGVEVLDVRLGDTVMILGTGPIGCWQAVMCRDRGASRVFMTDVSRTGSTSRSASSAASSTTRGSTGEDDDGVEHVLSRTDGLGAERVSVAAPSKQAQQAALEMAAKRARVVYFAGLPKHDPVSPLDMNQLHYKELAILGAYGATHRQYRITMDYLDRRQADLAPVVTHRFPLERIGEAFETIRSGTGLKMVIVP